MSHIIAIASVLIFSFSAHAARTYKLDKSHMQVGFKIKHLVIATVHGRFDKFEGAFKLDLKTKKLADVQAKIDINSINTNDSDRDKHLKGPDFFGAMTKDNKVNEKKRFMTFKSTKIEYLKKEPNKIIGQLTMNGKTKAVTLNIDYKGNVTDPRGNEKVVFKATTTIKRADFGLTWNKKLDKGGVVIGKTVDIILEGEANAS